MFLDLYKAYETLDRGHLLTKLEGYDAGPNMCRILAELWYRQEVFTQKNGYHVPHLQATKGTTQGGLVWTNFFNLVVNNFMRNWLSMMEENELVAQDSMRLAVGQCMGMLYTHDRLFGPMDSEWLQGPLNMLIELF